MKCETIPVAPRSNARANAFGAETETSRILARLGATVRRLRHRLGFSQETLAERAGLHRTYIAGIEGGGRNMTLKTLERLARALEVSPTALLTQTGEPAGRFKLAAGEPSNDKADTDAPPMLNESMSTPLNLLLVEDSPPDADLILEELRREGFDPKWKRVQTEGEFLVDLGKQPEIILSDYAMPGFTGLRAAKLLQESGSNIPFLLISGTVGEDVAVEAMKHGATD